VLNKINFFNKNGYCVVKIFSRKSIDSLNKSLTKKLFQKIKGSKFSLNNIHKINDEEYFSKITKRNKRFISFNKNVAKDIKKNQYLNNLLIDNWGTNNYAIKWVGDPRKEPIKNNKVGYRVVRPKNHSNNDTAGPHVDSHFEKNLKVPAYYFLTLWTPLNEFSTKNGLQIYPKTHLINHNIKLRDKNNTKVSPVLKKNYAKKFKHKKLLLKKGEVLIFHPNLIHGGGSGIGTNTRLSVEFRLFDKKRFLLYKKSILSKSD
tara:strand:- start:533 stop:1312 length:780 start_codon:yes stop_codon:yes gene_type:complete